MCKKALDIPPLGVYTAVIQTGMTEGKAVNSTYLYVGAFASFATGVFGGLTASHPPSPYIAGAMVLLSMALATRPK